MLICRSLENIEDREAFKGLDEKKENNNNSEKTEVVKPDPNENNDSGEKKDQTESESTNKADETKNDVSNESPQKVVAEKQDLTNEKSPEKEAPNTPNGNPAVKSDRPLPKYGIPSWDKDCLISLQRQQNRRRKWSAMMNVHICK